MKFALQPTRDINEIRNKCQHLEDINVIQTGNGPNGLNTHISELSGRKRKKTAFASQGIFRNTSNSIETCYLSDLDALTFRWPLGLIH